MIITSLWCLWFAWETYYSHVDIYEIYVNEDIAIWIFFFERSYLCEPNFKMDYWHKTKSNIDASALQLLTY